MWPDVYIIAHKIVCNVNYTRIVNRLLVVHPRHSNSSTPVIWMKLPCWWWSSLKKERRFKKHPIHSERLCQSLVLVWMRDASPWSYLQAHTWAEVKFTVHLYGTSATVFLLEVVLRGNQRREGTFKPICQFVGMFILVNVFLCTIEFISRVGVRRAWWLYLLWLMLGLILGADLGYTLNRSGGIQVN